MADAPVPEQQAPIVEQPQDQTPGVPVFNIAGGQAQPGTLHPDEVTEAVASGQFSLPKGAPIQVVDPDGQLGTMDPSEAPQAFQNGYKYASQKDIDASQYGTPLEQAKTVGKGLLTGLVGHTVGNAITQSLGEDPIAAAKRAEVNPGENIAANVAGFALPAIASLGSTALTKVGIAGLEGVPAAMQAAQAFTQAGVMTQAGAAAAKAVGMGGEAATIAAKLAQGSVKMGAEMALFQADDEAAKAIQQDPNQTAQSAMANIGMAAVLGGALGGAASGAGQLWKASGASNKLAEALGMIKNDSSGLPQTGRAMNPLAAKALSVASGVSEKDIEAYAANRAAVAAAPEFTDIYDHALNHIEQINQAVGESKLNAIDAEAAYKNLENDLKQEYKQRGFDAREAARMAKNDYKAAQEGLIAKTQEKALAAAAPATQAVETLRQQVVDGSEHAYNTLEESGQHIDMHNFYGHGIELMGDLDAKGTLESRAQAERLGQYLAGVKKDFGDLVPAAKVKPLIQGLDAVSKYDFNAAAFDKGMSAQYKQLRHTLDAELKNGVPAYRQAMLPVAEKTKLLGKLKNYGDEALATRSIKGLTNPAKYKNEMPLLRDLEGHTGMQFAQDIEPYANPELQAKLLRGVPEYKAHLNAAKLEAEMKNPETLQAMNDALAASKEHQTFMKAKAAAEEAKMAKQAISGITPANLQGKLLNAGKGKLGEVNAFEQFPKLNGQSLPEQLELSRVKSAFEKGAMNGSRNVNMYGGILGGIGGLMHGAGAIGGMGLGAGLGGVVDKYGPAMAKRVIDAYMNHFGDIAKLVAKPEARSAVRVALARMIDKDAALSAAGKLEIGDAPSIQGFKSAVELIHAAQKGEDLVKGASRRLFKAEQDVLPKGKMPSMQDLERLKKNLRKTWEAQQTPDAVQHMDKMTGPVGRYMPEHGTALTATTTNVTNYLKGLEPKEGRLGVLDALSPVTAAQKMAWDRTLGIAEQPLVVLEHIKKGTLTPKDMQDFHAMYPALYSKISQELTASMIAHQAKGNIVPYKTRIGLTLFLGQPMDSTLTGSAIMSAQPQPQQPAPEQQKSTAKEKGGMSKLPASYQTPTQARDAERSAGK